MLIQSQGLGTRVHHHVGAEDSRFYANLQKQLQLNFDQRSKIKSLEYSKFVADKKALKTFIYEQCDNATKTKNSLGRTYKTDCQDGNLIEFLNGVRVVCLGSNKGGLSFRPYKQVVSMKLMILHLGRIFISVMLRFNWTKLERPSCSFQNIFTLRL